MDLRFVNPTLTHLDELDSEVLMCSVWSDSRPSHGVAGLCDFRLGGWISSLERRGRITGQLGETVLLPGKPRLPFEKIVIFGAGPRATFDERVMEVLAERILRTADDLGARAVVLEMPGRHDNLLAAERAADILLAAVGRERQYDTWTLVENAEGRQRVMALTEDLRRIRRPL
ncbi:MAG: M17 family peptidase N-terminal domain-containing protein [Polyangiaceae bacterium]